MAGKKLGIGSIQRGDKHCLFGCDRPVISRGVCASCHVMILRLIGIGRITWAELENLGLSVPASRKTSAHKGKGFARTNRILAAVEMARKDRERPQAAEPKGGKHGPE